MAGKQYTPQPPNRKRKESEKKKGKQNSSTETFKKQTTTTTKKWEIRRVLFLCRASQYMYMGIGECAVATNSIASIALSLRLTYKHKDRVYNNISGYIEAHHIHTQHTQAAHTYKKNISPVSFFSS